MTQLTSTYVFSQLGDPITERHMVLSLFDPPTMILPKKLYCSKHLAIPLARVYKALQDHPDLHLIKTFDGCFNIRAKRGQTSKSLHSWGLAIDINASANRMGAKPTMPLSIVKAFTDNGFIWGGNWSTPDGMHFELSREEFTRQLKHV